ncbi:MAG: ABC transporter ATP-binding protein [Candidatus Dormibacteria bacterium]
MLRLDHITAGYGDTTVLRDVSLAVPTGRVVALLGANGAGKTTLMRVASGLLSPSAGTIRHDGVDLTAASSDRFVAAGVTLIPEGRGVFPNLTVHENLVLFAPPGQRGAAVERASAAFPRLGARLKQLAGTMSGGEQQMLALARAYVRPVKTLLLDEISMGLAPKLVDEIYEALSRIAATGVSLLLIEQFAPKSLAVADYVYLLSKGRITFAGEACELHHEAVFSSYLGGVAVGV